ncbi:MAG: potassium-transporting ATPase subunit KdpA [Thermomicrobiales bacterium]
MAALAWPLGVYMARVFNGERTLLSRVISPVERGIYRLVGVDAQRDMRWTTYTYALLIFNAMGFLAVYALQRLQESLPLNPAELTAVEERSSFNTAISFATNTNWQGYAGEVTLSYLTQMLALTTQNFVSAATGITVILALARGFSRKSTWRLGNFWVDLVRSILYVLLPLSVLATLLLVAGGVPQTFGDYVSSTGIQGIDQLMAIGPAASQIAIKQLGTNGGGFFNANSAHPFENPNALTGLIELISILLIPVALTFTFGKLIGRIKEGIALFATLGILLVIGLIVTTGAERGGNPMFEDLGASQSTTVNEEAAPGGNMEGKELRFGIPASTTWAVITTAASNGSVNSMHDSYTPLGGMIPLLNIATSEVIFGGVGSGLYGMLFYAIVAIFVAGVMVGRTPEYLGKKIEGYEIKMSMLGLLIVPVLILGMLAVATVTTDGLASRWNTGPHGLSEMLYAFSSAAGNNGSAFAGLTANVPFYNTLLGIAMLFGRFLLIVPALAMAGSLGQKQIIPTTEGTLPTTGALWVGLLAGVVVIIGALTFFPSVALGPVVEHFFMNDRFYFPAP